MNHLSLMLGLFTFWFILQTKAEEKLVKISPNDLKTIEQYLKENGIEKLDNDSTIENFIQYLHASTYTGE